VRPACAGADECGIQPSRECRIRPSGRSFTSLRGRCHPSIPDSAAAREDLPPELVEQARGYLQWCRNIHKQGDCLQVLRNGGVLDAHGRYAVAMAIAQGATIEATKDSLKGMVNPDAVMAMLVSGMTMYMMLWVLPEPVSKGIAAVMTVVLVAYIGVDTLYTLGRGWKALVNRADAATTFEELRVAGEEFAKVMGADTARILVMLATAAVGSEAASLAKTAPSLPGAVQASRLAVSEGSVALGAVGAVESVTIAESGLTIALAPGVVAMSSTSDDFGRGRPTSLSVSVTEGGPSEAVGRKAAPQKNPPYQRVQNTPATINGRVYTGHALDQMRNRGLTPSVVEDTIARGARSAGDGGATIYTTDQARVVLSPDGRVITVNPISQ
jgi:hypothetical protein